MKTPVMSRDIMRMAVVILSSNVHINRSISGYMLRLYLDLIRPVI